jgi:hypothetical protein
MAAVPTPSIERVDCYAGAGHPLPLWLEESSSLGSGGIFGRGTGAESGLVATSLFRVNARPRKPIAIKITPPIISQCGKFDRRKQSHLFPLRLQSEVDRTVRDRNPRSEGSLLPNVNARWRTALSLRQRRFEITATASLKLPSNFSSKAALSFHQTCCPQRILDYFSDAIDRSTRRLRPSSPGSPSVLQEWNGDRRELCVVLPRSFCFLALTRSRRQAPEASNTLRRRDVGIEHIGSDRATSVGAGIQWRPVTHPRDRIFFDSVPPIAVRPDAPLVYANMRVGAAFRL